MVNVSVRSVIEIENGRVDETTTLFVWLGEHSCYIGLYRYHGQAEVISSSALGQGHTSRAPALCPCWLVARTSELSISPDPAESDRKWEPIFYSFRVARAILPLTAEISAGLYILSYKAHFRFRLP